MCQAIVKKEPLIAKDDTYDENDDGVEDRVALSDPLTSIEGQDTSQYGLATQGIVSIPSTLFGLSSRPDSEYLNADYFSKDGQLSAPLESQTLPLSYVSISLFGIPEQRRTLYSTDYRRRD
ncbi:hypothetical protein VE03_10644, partial [Pseudogymnoascus sp. 23342-1-I1]